jgi:hypothetical protein
MSKSLLIAAVASILPAAHAETLPTYFACEETHLLVVRNTLTDFYHILYMGDDDQVLCYNVGGNSDFHALAVAAHTHEPDGEMKVYQVDDAIKNWDAIMSRNNRISAQYVMSVIKENQSQSMAA